MLIGTGIARRAIAHLASDPAPVLRVKVASKASALACGLQTSCRHCEQEKRRAVAALSREGVAPTLLSPAANLTAVDPKRPVAIVAANVGYRESTGPPSGVGTGRPHMCN